MKTLRQKPVEMQVYEVLMRRAIVDEKTHRELSARFHALRAGYAGERRVDNEWREVRVQGTLLHDFTCRNPLGNTHQIDTVFVCKHFVLVVEIKNVTGRIDFDDNRRQFLRTREDGVIESFNNPIDQVKRHRELLIDASIDWPFYVPVEAFVVIANPSTVIGRVSNEVPVFNVSGLRTKVVELTKKHAGVNVNVRAVRGLLEEMYEPIERSLSFNYPIRKGVFCAGCGDIMLHSDRGFKCPRCGARDKNDTALRQALFDYRVLYGERISNSAFRDFVGVENVWTANKILNRIAPEKEGKNKGTVHLIPSDIHSKLKNPS